MRRPSFSAVALLSVAMLAGSGFAALRHANGVICAVAFVTTCSVLALATVGAVCRPTGRRAGWVGFALFGWGYMALVFGPWTPAPALPDLPTTRVLEALRTRLKLRVPEPRPIVFMQMPVDPPAGARPAPGVGIAPAPEPAAPSNPAGGTGTVLCGWSPEFWGRSEDGFLLTGHCLWSLLAACVGGVASHLLVSTMREATVPDREPQTSPPADDRRRRRRGLSVLKLMGAVVLAGLGLAALRNASAMISSATFLVACVVLALATVGAVCRPAGRRAGWVGFALLGWGYMALAFTPFLGYETEPGHFARRPTFATTRLLETLFFKAPSLRGTDAHGSDSSFQTIRVLAALEKPVPIPFKKETSLADVVRFVRDATVSPELPDGIPIFIDPNGLQEQDKTTDSTISLELKGVPLRITFSLMLRQLDLDYEVTEGLLYVRSRSDISYALEDYGPFQRIGHCLFALLFGALGGLAGPLVAGRRRDGEA